MSNSSGQIINYMEIKSKPLPPIAIIEDERGFVVSNIFNYQNNFFFFILKNSTSYLEHLG
ncbi:MAG: hypothetical protein WA057_03915 [Candidatus Magasanikiibacteriota bacterium]